MKTDNEDRLRQKHWEIEGETHTDREGGREGGKETEIERERGAGRQRERQTKRDKHLQRFRVRDRHRHTGNHSSLDMLHVRTGAAAV